MDATTKLNVILEAQDKTGEVLKKAGDNMSGFASGALAVTKKVAEGLLVAGTAVAGFGALSVKAFMESEDVQAQLNATLTSTHHAAGLYIQDLNDQSHALQNVTKFSDEQIGSAQALLLTFTNIHGAVFQQATPAILDLATAMHEDLQSASVQVGKALNDPLTGITALHRVGVTFSDTQKQQIQNFVDTNNVAAAQGVILGELQKEFGGSAQAAGKTFGGQLTILKNKLNDMEETIGSLILKYLVPLVSKIDDFVSKVDFQKVINRSIQAVRDLGEAFHVLTSGDFRKGFFGLKEDDPVIGALIKIHDVFDTVKTAVVAVFNYLEPSFAELWNTLATKLLPSLMQLYNALEPGLNTVLKILAGIIGITLIAAIHIFVEGLNVTINILSFLIRVVSDVIGWVGNMGGAFVNFAKAIPGAFSNIGNAILGPFKWAFDEIAKFWNATVGKLSFKAPSWIPGMGGKGWDMPDLPVLDSGGIVSSPTLAVLAANSRPEAIIPLDQMPSGGGVNITVNMGMYAGMPSEKRQIAVDLYKEIVREARSHGVQMPQLGGTSIQ